MATNDEIIAKLPDVLAKLQKTNERAAKNAALAEKRKLAALKKQQTIANKKGNAKTRADLDAIQELKDLRKDIKDREVQQAAMAESSAGQAIALKAELESQGKIAEDNKEFQKLSYEARKEDYAQRLEDATSPAAKKQIREDARNDAKNNASRLGKIAAGIKGLFEMGKKGLKTAALGGMALLSTLAIGGLLIALGKFLQSDTFKDMTKFIQEEILPYLTEIGIAIASIVGAVAIVKFIKIANQVKNAFIAVKTFMLVTMLENVKGMIGGVVGKFKDAALLIKNAFIAVQVFALKTMLPAIQGMVGGVVAQFASIANKIKLAFIAVQTFMLGTMLPAITAFMVPLLPVIAIAAAVALVLYGLYEAFQDFRKTLDETGSIGEAIKVAIGKFIGVLLGAIPALFLKLVAFVADLFGFKEFAKKVGDIDPIQFIADSVTSLIDSVVDFFKMLFDFDFSGYIGGMIKKAGGLVGRAFSGLFGGSDESPEDAKAKRETKLQQLSERSQAMSKAQKADIEQTMSNLVDSKTGQAYRSKGETQQEANYRAAKYKEEMTRNNLESQKIKPSQYKESASIVEKMEKSKQQAELAKQQSTAAGPTNIVDARQSSSVTTTGQSGNSSLVNNKFGRLNINAAGSGLDM